MLLRSLTTTFLVAMLLTPRRYMHAADDASFNAAIVVKLTKYQVKPSYQARLRRSISNYISSAMKHEGNIMAEAYQESTDTTILWVIERWSSELSVSNNQETKQAKALMMLVNDAIRSPVEVTHVIDLEPLPKTAYRRAPKSSDQPFTIMLFVDAKEGTQAEFRKLYHAAMPEFRKEPGVVTYQLTQVTTDDTKFITYEKFRNEAAFQYHLKIPAVEPVIAYLRSSIKEQPFEKGLHRLIEFAPLIRE